MITGATGFAGSFLVEHYAREGWRVHGTYHLTDDDRGWLPAGVTLHRVDLRDRGLVSQLVKDTRPDVVQHLAAQSSVAVSWQDPMATLTDNAASQYNLLEGVLAHSRGARVVVVGSCDEYGDVAPEDNPVSETQELRPLSPYALSKVAQDLMGRQYAVVHGLAVVRTRPFLQIGPRRSAAFVAGSFAKQVAEIARGQREPVIRVGNIDLRRDFTDVRDVVLAYALAAERGAPGEVYNIASGRGFTLREVLGGMLRDAKVEAEIRVDPDLVRSAETPLLIGDASRLRWATGWAPTVPFEQSIADTLAWWQDRVDRIVLTERTHG